MKHLVEWFSRNHIAANFLMWGILATGFLSWFQLRKEIFPDLQLNTVSVQVPYPNAAPEEVEKDVRLAAAIEWYRSGLISQGRAAELAGVPRATFIDELARRKIDVFTVDFEELRAEIGLA